MKRATKYVALDVHQATTVAAVREESGRVIARSVLPTDGAVIAEFIRGMRGAVQVTFEEGTQAQWLHDLLATLVDRVVVCDRRGAPPKTGGDNECTDRGGTNDGTQPVQVGEPALAEEIEDATRR